MRKTIAALALLAVVLLAAPAVQAQTCEPSAPPPYSCVVNPPTNWGCWIARIYVQDTDGAVYQAVESPCGEEPDYGAQGYATVEEAIACGRYYQRNGALMFAGNGRRYFKYRPVVGYEVSGPESAPTQDSR